MAALAYIGAKHYQADRNAITNAAPAIQPATEQATTNDGGFLGGMGYFFEKLGLGFLSGVEGVWDYTAGGLAKLFGADKWAERQFANDWVNYNHADEWYNPSSGWQTAGDVAGGIGTSLPSILAVVAGAAITYFSGGSLSAPGVKLMLGGISAGISGLGAAGNATKEAYKETGELGGAEFGYGALTGATEAGIEFVTSGIGKGTGRIVNSIAGKAARETTETVGKAGIKTIFKQLGEDFVSEAFEEGLAEVISPVYQRMTYNPDAENASLDEVAYAALIGGLSGMVMSGSSIGINASVNTTQNFFSGKKATETGTYAGIFEAGRAISDAEAKNETGIESFKSMQDTYYKLVESLKKNNGIATTEELIERVKSGNITFKARDMMYLGKLKRTSVVAHIHPYIEKSAEGLIFNADNAARRYTSFGMTDANGNLINVTADDILSGIDRELVEKARQGNLSKAERNVFVKSIRKALSENTVLSTLSVAEATGQIVMNTRKFAEAALNGSDLANDNDLNRFIETARPEELKAVGEALGIEDWSKVNAAQLQQKIAEFNESGKVSEYSEQAKRMKRALEEGKENIKPLPRTLEDNMDDGVYRYADELGKVDMAIFKEGDSYRFYDYKTGDISRSLTVSDVNTALKAFWDSGEVTTAKSMQFNEQTNLAKEAVEINRFAQENIEGYKKLSEPNKAAVRMTVRQARAHGLTDAETLVFAKVAAKSGVNIIFDDTMAIGDGSFSGNTIKINPKTPGGRTFEIILGHEMFHKLFAEGDKRAAKLFTKAKELIEKSDPAKADEVFNKYNKFYKKQGASASKAHADALEEVSAAGIETIFKSKDVWEYILSEDPTMAQKVLSFFRKSAREYSDIPGMSAEARKAVRTYKKLFEAVSEQNQGNNALSIELKDAGIEKSPVTSIIDENMHVTGENDEEKPDVTGADVDKDARFALSKGKAERLKNDLVKLGTLGIRLDAGGKSIRILTDKFTQNKNIFSNKGRNMREINARIKAIPHFAEILRSCTYEGTDTEIHGLENEAKKGVIAMHRFKGSYDGFDIEVVVRDKGSKQFLYEIKFIEKEKSPQQSMTDESASPAPLGDAENKPIITHSEKKSNPSDKNSSKNVPMEKMALAIGGENVAVEVEEEGDLLAIHNLTEQNLLDTLKLGGFPMPSIAIIRAEQEHSNYGAISVVFGRDTIDPESTYKNKVYGSDAWTPTSSQARTEYPIDVYKSLALEQKLDELSSQIADGAFSNSSMIRRLGIDSVTEQNAARIAERLSNTDEARAAYLASQGISIEPVYKKKAFNAFGNEALQKYIDTVGVEHLAGIIAESLADEDSVLRSEAETVELIIREAYEEKHSYTLKKRPDLKDARIDAFMKNHVTMFTIEDFVKDAWEYYNEGGTVTEEIDRLATSEKIRESVDDKDVRNWLEPQIAEIVGEPGIYNGKDPFYPSGKRRSFAETHYSYTAENIVKAMQNSKARGVSTFGINANTLIATSTPSYRSVDEMRADKSRLRVEDAAKYEKMLAELDAAIKAVEDDIMSANNKHSYEDYDTIGDIISEAAAGSRTAVAIQKAFSKEGYRITLGQAKKIIELYDKASKMPTGYFEAKPERVVGFSEIKMVELPENVSDKLKEKLSARNIPYEVYGNTDAERANAIRNLEGVKFALTDYTEEQYNSFGWVRANDVISAGHWKTFTTNFADAIARGYYFNKTPAGEFMIEAYNYYDSLSEADVIVFAKGTIENPIISKIVKINLTQGIDIEAKRSELYATERKGIRRPFGEIFTYYSKSDFISKRKYERNSVKSIGNNNRFNVKRSESEIKANPVVEFHVNEDENTVTYRYANGQTITESLDEPTNSKYALADDPYIDEIFGDVVADGKKIDFDPKLVLEKGSPRRPGASTLTVGEMKKVIANNTHYTVFSKKTALKVIKNMYGVSDLSPKTVSELSDALWQGLNDCADSESRAAFAHDMAEFITAKLVTEAKVQNPDIMQAQEKLSYLSTYIGLLSFSAQDIAEMRHKADVKGMRKILGRWGFKGKKNSRRVPMDVFVTDIAREMPGMSYLEGMHPFEAFMELNAVYERAKADVKDEWISAYYDMPDSEIHSLVESIEEDIRNAFVMEGEKSKFAKLVENRIGYYQTEAEFWKERYDDVNGRDRIVRRVISKARELKDLKVGKFANATQVESDMFNQSVGKLARINYREDVNKAGTRTILGEVLQWYNSAKENILSYTDEQNPGYYDQGVADMLEMLSTGKGELTQPELKMLHDVLSYFTNFMKNYGKVYYQGRLVEAEPMAKEFVRIAQENEELKIGFLAKLTASKYAQLFNDPYSLVQRMDYYEDGFFTAAFNELQVGLIGADIAEMEIMEEYDDFLNSNKKYIKNITTKTVEYHGHKIPKTHLISLYMTMKRKHAWAGLAINGFNFKNLEGKIERVPGFVTDEHISEDELAEAVKNEREKIEKLLDDKDRQYIDIIERGYNQHAKNLKANRDMQMRGYTNATEDYYYPIRRAYIAKNIDADDAQAEYDRVSNASFNKDVVKGAKQELGIESADALYRRHIHAVSQYAYLAPAIEFYNRIYNMDISGNRNHPISVRTETQNTWAQNNKYMRDLIADVQGIAKGGSKVVAGIRGAYAKATLGANIKVWVTQLSSYLGSSSILDIDCLTKGAFVSSDGIYEFCPLAKLRKYDNTAAMAQAVLDPEGKAKGKAGKVAGKVEKISEILMKPIGAVDSFVVGRLFGACQLQIQKNGGAKVGTIENKRAAGKLLQSVLLKTQQNTLATSKSAAMRSSSEFIKMSTMFTADANKVIGRVIDGLGKVSILKAKIRAEKDPVKKAELKARLKQARKELRKAEGALILTSIFMAGVAQLFRWLYAKDDEEDKTIAETMAVDAVSNLFGGLPIVSDIISRIVDGYGIDDPSNSAINDFLDSAMNIFDIVTGNSSGPETARKVRNLIYSISQLTGLPIRNLYNTFYGFTKRFSPETAYKIDSAFYEKNYQKDLFKAIENDDADMASFILGLLYNERMGENISQTVHNELYSLSAKGYKVIPRIAPNSITVDGVSYPLNASQQEAVRKSYSAAGDTLERLFASTGYKRLSDDMKAEAVNYVYSAHYDVAIEDALGVDRGKSVLISSIIGIEKLALVHVATKDITADTNRQGMTISGSKRKKVIAAINKIYGLTKVEKILMVYAKGYTLQDGDILGVKAESANKLLLNHILRNRNLTKAQKAELSKLCGFETKNGSIILKKPS